MTNDTKGKSQHGEVDEKKFGRAIAASILIGTPAAIIVIVTALWIFTDADLGRAFTTGIWPGVLTGVFGGGFIGVILGSD